MRQAVIVEEVSKYFVEWKKKPVNGKIIDRIFSFLRWKRKKFYAVNKVSLSIREGEIFGVLGANGSGKSTLIRLIATLLLPDSGSIRVFGHDVNREELAVRRMINRVSVEASFFKKLSAWENLAYSARLYGYTPTEARPALEEIFKHLELPEEKLSGSLENLSRGMQQKVAIARALFTSPSLLLLDEPTTGLDPKSKIQVQSFVRKMNKENGITTLLTTHDMNEAELLCNRLVIMKEGRIVAEGTPTELKKLITNGNGKSEVAVTLEEVFLKLANEGN
ncbi:MAG: ABC transporter ATP-binding protein [Candidatus Eremiobacteraeota bacterium]|nr:ABC transporter ATP-binding protein [Candidatus Eremiobacteraeota bacterium]